jgi:hypothetical protein
MRSQIAVMYLTVLVGGLTAFVFCTFWVYHYVDLSHDMDDEDEEELFERSPEDIGSMGFGNFLMPAEEGRSTKAASYYPPLSFAGGSNDSSPMPFRKTST